MFCHECEQEICVSCMGSHPRHLIISIQEAKYSLGESLRSDYENFTAQVRHLEHSTREAKDVESEAENDVRMCMTAMDFVRQVVDEEEVNLLTDILQKANFQTGSAAAAKTERRMTITKMILYEMSKKLVKIADSMQLLKQTQAELEQLKRMAERRVSPPTCFGTSQLALQRIDSYRNNIVSQIRTKSSEGLGHSYFICLLLNLHSCTVNSAVHRQLYV